MFHTTIEEAKQAALQQAPKSMQYHVYIYRKNGVYGVLWHGEDRYLFSVVPEGAHIVFHAELVRRLDAGQWVSELTEWEPRGNVGSEDVEVIASHLGTASGRTHERSGFGHRPNV